MGSIVMAFGLESTASIVMTHGLSCSVSCGIFLDQGSNLRLLHGQEDSLPLSHQDSPRVFLISFFYLFLLKYSRFIYTIYIAYVFFFIFFHYGLLKDVAYSPPSLHFLKNNQPNLILIPKRCMLGWQVLHPYMTLLECWINGNMHYVALRV